MFHIFVLLHGGGQGRGRGQGPGGGETGEEDGRGRRGRKTGEGREREGGERNTHVGMSSDLGQSGVIKSSRITCKSTGDIVGVFQADQSLNLVEPAARFGGATERMLATLPKFSRLRLVDVGHPAVMLAGPGTVDILLENYDVVVGDLVLCRGGGRQERSSTLINDSRIEDGGSDRDSDGGEESKERSR